MVSEIAGYLSECSRVVSVHPSSPCQFSVCFFQFVYVLFQCMFQGDVWREGGYSREGRWEVVKEGGR